MNIDKFTNYKYISSLTSNEDNSLLCYLVSIVNLEKDNYESSLFSFDGTRHKRIFNFKQRGNFIFKNNHSVLINYYKTKEDEKNKEKMVSSFYEIDLDSKALKKAFDIPFPVNKITHISNDNYLLEVTLPEKLFPLLDKSFNKREALVKEYKDELKYVDIDELPFYFNGAGFVANNKNLVLLYNALDNTWNNLLDDIYSINGLKLSLDKKSFVFSGNKKGTLPLVYDNLYKYNLSSQKLETLYGKSNFVIHDFFETDKEMVVFASNNRAFGMSQNPDIYLLKNNDFIFKKTFGLSLGNSVGSDVRLGGGKYSAIYNNNIYFTSTIEHQNKLLCLDEYMNLNIVSDKLNSIDGIALLQNNIYSFGLYKQELQEIYLLNSKGNSIKAISRYNKNMLKGDYVARPKKISYKSNGDQLFGYILFPKDFDESQKYPMILDIHGGPKTVYGEVLYHEMQVWANLGYFVIFTNPHGSDGRGNEFADIRGKYGTIEYEDLMKFVDIVLNKYSCIDEKKLFVTGGSYGGFMTNWIIGHTNRFKAAATQRSISNWVSFYGTSDIGLVFASDQTDGNPFDKIDNLIKQSPITYADKMETPTLIIHSEQDYRCPIEQGMQLFSILKAKGVPTKMVWFKEENHELSRGGKPKARIKRLQEITDWFGKHLND